MLRGWEAPCFFIDPVLPSYPDHCFVDMRLHAGGDVAEPIFRGSVHAQRDGRFCGGVIGSPRGSGHFGFNGDPDPLPI